MAPYGLPSNNLFSLFSGLILTSATIYNYPDIKEFFLTEYNALKIIMYAFLISLIVILVFYFFTKNSLNFEKNTNHFIKMTSVEEYEKITQKTTEEEKEKLFETDEFAKMMLEQGEDEAKWNWQLRDRIKGSLNNISDDELENIDVSIDEQEGN